MSPVIITIGYIVLFILALLALTGVCIAVFGSRVNRHEEQLVHRDGVRVNGTGPATAEERAQEQPRRHGLIGGG